MHVLPTSRREGEASKRGERSDRGCAKVAVVVMGGEQGGGGIDVEICTLMSRS